MSLPKNEEEVKIHIVLPWLEQLGYKKDVMDFEKTIDVSEGRKKKSIFADIVIYTDKKKVTPLIVVDTKGPYEILSKDDRDQVISYARLLPKIAPIAILTNGAIPQIYKTLDKTRIKELPERKHLLTDFVGTVLSEGMQAALKEEAKKELFIIDDVKTFKELLKKCHNTIRNNEGYDPIQAFDELSKVLFAKMYEEQYNKDDNRFTVDIFDDTLKKLKVNIVQKQFSEIQETPRFKDLFTEGTRIDLKDRTIREIVEIFEKFDLTLTRFDVKGEAFEYFLGDTFTGGLGEYFTPRNVVEFIVECVSPKIGEKIIDPFCGTGGFLIYAFEIVSDKIKLQDFSDDEKEKWKTELSDRSLFGTDWKPRTSQACKMNMIVHGDGNTGIFQHNGFIDVPKKIEKGTFDICLTNPPFGAKETEEKLLKSFELGNGRTSQSREVLAIERCLQLVKPGKGIVAFVLPDGILNGDRNSYVREYINREAEVIAVIGLNKETFEGYNATVKTSVVILRRKLNPEASYNQQVFMAVCTNSGYSTLGTQIPGNQLPDILFDFRNYQKDGSTQFMFPNSSIVTIKNPGDRLDAERYIAYLPKLDIEPNEKITERLFGKLNEMADTNTNVSQFLKKNGFINPFKNDKFEYVPISELIESCNNEITLVKDMQYVQLGIRGNGMGIFARETNFGSEIEAKKLNQVKEGWMAYSRLFAKNGSFAVIEKEHENGVFSKEFPTFRAKEYKYNSRDLLDYIVFYLVSPQATNYIIRLTTGSTKESRGRFKEDQLMEFKIPIPKTQEDFNRIVEPIKLRNNYYHKLRDLRGEVELLAKSFQSSLPDFID